MILKNNLVIKSFTESSNKIKKKKLLILAPVIIDLLFIVSFGFSIGYFISNIEEKAVALIQTGKSILYSGGLLKGLLANNESLSIILSAIGIMIATYIQYCIFQGLSWRFAKMFSMKKVPVFNYIKKFFLVNIFWFVLFFLVQLTDYGRRLLGYLRGENFDTLSSGLSTIIVIIIYFALISYALVAKYKTFRVIKKSFVIGIIRFYHIIPLYIVISVIFFILDIISRINQTLMLITGFLLVTPALTWARVFINLVVGKLDKG